MADARVQDVMTHLVVMLYPNESVHAAARKLSRNRISGAPVVEAGKVVGVVSEADIVAAVLPSGPTAQDATFFGALPGVGRLLTDAHRSAKTVGDVMTSAVVEVSPATSVWRAASLMELNGIKRLPVVDEDGYLVGVVSRSDIVRAMAREDAEIRRDVVDAIEILGPETIRDLTVSVVDGVATLDGVADRRSTKELAAGLAARTPGVTEVVDRLDHEVDGRRRRAAPPVQDPKDPRLDWHPSSEVHEGVR